MADRAILGADTLYARGKDNLFIAKYGATALSSEHSDVVPSWEIEVSNYPNPFRHRATIAYRVSAPGHVRLTVYDVLGRELAVLVDERQSAGSHSAKLDASGWPSGVYLYRLEAGNRVPQAGWCVTNKLRSPVAAQRDLPLRALPKQFPEHLHSGLRGWLLT